MNRIETHKRNLELKNLLQNHKGLENAIKTKKICEKMGEYGYKIPTRQLPNLIQKLREEYNLPIGYARGKGYFVAKSRKDIEITVSDMEMQIKTLQATISFMKSFIIE